MKWLACLTVLLCGVLTTSARGGEALENQLFQAVETGNLKQVEHLVAQGATVTTEDQFGDTPLHWAVGHGHSAVAAFLVAHGADVSARDRKGQTPLFGADNSAVAKLLIRHGAKVGVRDVLGQTPLATAAWRGRLAVVKVLIAHGADVNARDKRGFTPLDNAAWAGRGSPAVEAVLRAHGAVASRTPGLISRKPPRPKVN